MKVDKTKLYNALITLCWCVIIFCSILKIFGYKEFEIPIFSENINIWIKRIINCILYNINSYCFFTLLFKRLPKLKEMAVIIPISILIFISTLFDIFVPFKILFEAIFYIVVGKIYTNFKIKQIIIESIFLLSIMTIYQLITMSYKNINIRIIVNGFIEDKVLQIDFYTLLIITMLHEIKERSLLYERGIKFLVILSKPKRFKECLFKNKKSIQEVDEQIGFKLFIIFLSIAQLVGVGVCCYFINNVIVEYVIIVMSFFILRKVFGKCYHANSVIKCTTLSILVFVIATRLSLPLWLSVFCNVLIGCLVAYTMYVMYYFIKFTTTTGITIHKGMSLEDLNSLCELHNVDEIDKTILVEYYVNRKRLDAIAYKLNYSTDAIKKRKANILKRIKEV